MLIITRRTGERIMLGDDTTIHIMEIVGNNVRVGVEAPKSVPVYREEIWTAVKEENRAAAAAEQTKAAPQSIHRPTPSFIARREPLRLALQQRRHPHQPRSSSLDVGSTIQTKLVEQHLRLELRSLEVLGAPLPHRARLEHVRDPSRLGITGEKAPHGRQHGKRVVTLLVDAPGG